MKSVSCKLADDEEMALERVRQWMIHQYGGAMRVGDSTVLRWCLHTTCVALGLHPGVPVKGDDHAITSQ
jgi:hypothetical protein